MAAAAHGAAAAAAVTIKDLGDKARTVRAAAVVAEGEMADRLTLKTSCGAAKTG